MIKEWPEPVGDLQRIKVSSCALKQLSDECKV
jgi:hypothetical protein